MSDDRPLPYGWVKEWDENYQQFYYVDTKAEPPRSIWIHPYEDEQYLKEHPEVREKVGSSRNQSYPAPSGPPDSRRPSSYDAGSSSAANTRDPANVKGKEKRSFLAKLKDKAIGTKEEREAARLAEQRMMDERRRRLQAARQQRQQAYPQQAYGGYGQSPGYGGYQSYNAGYPQQNGYYAPQAPPPRRGGGFGGGLGMPILGGLAGGLLLGEALDGFGGDGGDGGGDGGGDFGGGDFGGGGDF